VDALDHGADQMTPWTLARVDWTMVLPNTFVWSGHVRCRREGVLHVAPGAGGDASGQGPTSATRKRLLL